MGFGLGFRRPFKDCDRIMSSAYGSMTEAELSKALQHCDPRAADLSDLLIEMWKRGMTEAHEYGMALMSGNRDGNLHHHPDARLYDVLEVLCGCFRVPCDAQDWLKFAYGYEQRILDALMAQSLRENRRMGYEVLELAKSEGNYHIISNALLSVIECVPSSDAELQTCLIHWAKDREVLPKTRIAIFNRFVVLPRTEELEDFLVRCHIEDKGDDAAITSAINLALRQ